MSAVEINGRPVGSGHPCFVIGEVAQSHDGSLGQAYAFIDAIASAGADAIKFQTHIASAESTRGEPWRVKFSMQDATRYDYWRRMEFTEEQWKGLKRRADERGLAFLSSPFSLEAVSLLQRVGVPAWKIASGEVSNQPLLKAVAKTGLPVIISSGMSPIYEIDGAVSTVRDAGAHCALLQCTSVYPTPPEKIGLNVIEVFKKRYGCPVGLSDQSGTIFAALAAVTLGISLLEIHVTLSREMFGPDVASSVTTAELRQLVSGIRYIERMTANPVDKDRMASELAPMRALFTKSVVARRDLAAGSVITPDDVIGKKPGTGIPIERLDLVVGRKSRRTIPADKIITEDDLEAL